MDKEIVSKLTGILSDQLPGLSRELARMDWVPKFTAALFSLAGALFLAAAGAYTLMLCLQLEECKSFFLGVITVPILFGSIFSFIDCGSKISSGLSSFVAPRIFAINAASEEIKKLIGKGG